MKKRLAREYFTSKKYYYTSLRFIVKIYKAPKPKGVGDYSLVKTERRYMITSTYHVYRDSKLIKRVPLIIAIPIKSKDRTDLRISVPRKVNNYGKRIRKALTDYYLNV